MTDKASQNKWKRDERQRKRELGMVPKEIWVYPEKWQETKEAIKRVNS